MTMDTTRGSGLGKHDEGDVKEWLERDLGIHHPWNSVSIHTQLNPEMISAIRDVFGGLSTQVKLKTLLSIFHITQRNLKEWKADLEELLEIALNDNEESVTMLAEIMQPYPSTGTVNFDLKFPGNEENKRLFDQVTAVFSQDLQNAKSFQMIPKEFYYLNKTAREAITGPPRLQETPVLHFQVKGKTKADILREELLTKAALAAEKENTSKKRHLPIDNDDGIPSRVRAMPKKISTLPRRAPISIPGSVEDSCAPNQLLNVNFD